MLSRKIYETKMLVKCFVRRFLSLPITHDGATSLSMSGFAVSGNLLGLASSRLFATSAVAREVIKELGDLPAIQDVVKKPDPLETSDLERLPRVEYSQRCLEFDGLEEYDKAPEIVQRLLTLQYADHTVRIAALCCELAQHAYRKRVETDLVRRVQRFEDDFDSPEVAIARQTAGIRFERQWVQNLKAQRGPDGSTDYSEYLVRHVNELNTARNDYLTSLRSTHYEKFAWILDQLKISYQQQCPQDENTDHQVYDRLRINEAKSVRRRKFEKYHQELKARQSNFLEQKDRELKALDEEERGLRKSLAELEAAEPVELQEDQLIDEIATAKEAMGFKKKRTVFAKSPPYIPPKDVGKKRR